MDASGFARRRFVRHKEVVEVSFTRSARKHGVPYADMLHAMAHARHVTTQPAVPPHQEDRVLFLGPATEAASSQPLEVLAVERATRKLLVPTTRDEQ